MTRREHDRLRHIHDAIGSIEGHVQGGASRLNDPLVHDAVLYQFVVIGEAVKNLSSELQAQAPEVPWQDVAGLRDLIAHEYFRIEAKRIAKIVEANLPALREAIDRMLSDQER